MKKLIALALAAVMLVCTAVVGSVAYLTDTDNDVNIMVMGDVEIEQFEMERAKDENGEWYSWLDDSGNPVVDEYGYMPDALQPFTQGQKLLPSIYMDGTTKWDDRNGSQAASGTGSHQQSWAEVGAPGSNQLFDSSVKNVLDKFVFVKNTGNEDLYFRTWVAIECPENVDPKMIHTSWNANARYTRENLASAVIIEGVRYIVTAASYTERLVPDEVSRPSFLQVFLDPKTSSKDVEAFGETLDILVFTQAVQAEGWEATTDANGNAVSAGMFALDSAFGAVEDSASLPWADADWDVWSGKSDTTWYNPNRKSFLLTTPEQLAGVAELVNTGVTTFKGVTLKLAKNMDLGNKEWTPVAARDRFNTKAITFEGTLDGDGYTVSNLKIRGGEGEHYLGLIGHLTGTVKNLTVDGADVVGSEGYVGAIVGQALCVKIENCHVLNGYFEGADKVGAVVGQVTNDAGSSVLNCSATNVSIVADREAGIVIGYNGRNTVTENVTADALSSAVWSGNGDKGATVVNAAEGYKAT